MTDYLLRDSCFGCDDLRHEFDTGASFCHKTPYHDQDCETVLACRELSDKAQASADHWSAHIRHTPPDIKREAVEQEADVFSNWAWNLGATFDSDGFIRACGCGGSAGQLAALVAP